MLNKDSRNDAKTPRDDRVAKSRAGTTPPPSVSRSSFLAHLHLCVRHSFICALFFASYCAFSWPASSLSAPFSFDDIEYWVGEGSNRAAVVIDWSDQSPDPPALAWGYRWDGDAKGRDMLLAVLTADDRLFAKLGGSASNAVAVYGLGYDADNDGEFGLDDGTVFDEVGIAFTGPADLGQATDAGDDYAEGWFTGFWHYGKADINPYDGGSWDGTPSPMFERALSDGAWDSWTFSPTFNFAAYAQNPQAAAAPSGGGLAGDYSGNGTIDAADYAVWRDTMTASGTFLPNDATPGSVDESDFLYWRDHFGESWGSGASGSASDAGIVPEPSACLLAVTAMGALWLTTQRPRKEHDS